ncbi:hypothetical protein [Paraburkholderia tuberum]|uniref:Uncharacterized protein n=1 Tax=Paraburkholderia tuberum TaxID=157910 RepID=A0A1H0ZP47_9BURK|nr:hypothetical protein [Paraburkholderia tuberum]SDQ29203.1 hypothetical protein SAMN05445850_0145 [Paraburkholderia tuberum]
MNDRPDEMTAFDHEMNLVSSFAVEARQAGYRFDPDAMLLGIVDELAQNAHLLPASTCAVLRNAAARALMARMERQE